MPIVDELLEILATQGRDSYHGEAVSQVEHALQSAYQAEAEGATDELVVAALLHDVGHLVGRQAEDVATRGIDARHEDEGAHWLAEHFPPAVVEPIRLHVAAKRYLCAVDPAYRSRLSDASELSLRLQGGVMSAEECSEFERGRYYADALKLRHWDDGAKVEGWAVPGLEHYRECLARVLMSRSGQ